MKIGLVQAPSTRKIAINLKTIKNYVIKARDKECAVLCFPECFLTGYAPEEAKNLSITRDCEALKKISEIAVACEIDILMGFMEAEGEAHYITHGIFKSSGEAEYYRKTHLGEKEAIYFSEGDMLNVFELSDGVKIGFQLCVEIHFLEITKALSLRGAEIVFAPHAVPKKAGSRKVIWSKIIPARCYDNRVYMACCNQWDEDRFGGGCLVTDPKGDVVAEYFEDKEGLLVAEIDTEEIRRYHEENAGRRYRYYPSKGRKELYE